MEYLILIIGFILLIKGADIFVDGCISVAKMFGIPSMIIGLTIVAMGTSAPEASVSISAAVKGAAGIAVGNIVGSNLFNLLLIIGICLFFAKMDVSKVTLVRDYPYYLGTMIILLILSIGGTVGRVEGIILFLLMAIYMVILIRDAIKIYKDIRADYTSAYPIYPNGTFRLRNKGIFTLGLCVPEKNIVYLAIWKINTEDSELTIDFSKYGTVKKAYKLYPELNNYTLSCWENEITAKFPDGNCAMLVKIEY